MQPEDRERLLEYGRRSRRAGEWFLALLDESCYVGERGEKRPAAGAHVSMQEFLRLELRERDLVHKEAGRVLRGPIARVRRSRHSINIEWKWLAELDGESGKWRLWPGKPPSIGINPEFWDGGGAVRPLGKGRIMMSDRFIPCTAIIMAEGENLDCDNCVLR